MQKELSEMQRETIVSSKLTAGVSKLPDFKILKSTARMLIISLKHYWTCATNGHKYSKQGLLMNYIQKNTWLASVCQS